MRVAVGLVLAGLVASAGSTVAPASTAREVSTSSTGGGAAPLSGVTIVLDPGHQLGNHNYPQQTSRLVPAGGFRKPCNSTGTATNAGFPEATFNWRVAVLVRDRLRSLGARVVMTRTANREDLWGPCVDERGRRGNSVAPDGRPADLKISIHGDGHRGGHGFHVIAPTDRAPWTDDIYGRSRRLALVVRAALHTAGLPYATYLAGGDGLAFRSDLATLNLSDIPTVLVELGNMRSAADARRMTSAAGRREYARALVSGARSWLRR